MIKKINYQTKRLVFLLGLMFMGLSLKSQSGSFGSTYIHELGQVTVTSGSHSFTNGSLVVLPGIIGTDRTGARGHFGFVNGTGYTGVSNSQHVDGYVKSFNTTPFIFPIGDNGKYRPVKITTSSTANPTTAAYFNANPSIAVTSSLKGGNEPPLPNGTYSTAATDFDVKNVSTVEYWDINGQTSAQITLTWDLASGVSAMTGSNLSNLTIVGWTGTKWVVIPSSVDVTSILGGSSTLTSGSITSTAAITPDAYDVYTIAVSCLVTTPTNIALSKNSVCAGGSIVLSAISADTLKWYTDAALTQLVGIGNNLSVTPAISTRYYAAQVSGICVSTAVSDSVTVFTNCLPFPILDTVLKNPTPGSPVVVGPSIPTPIGGSVSATIIGGFNHRGADAQSINPTTGQVTFTPNDTAFVGQDTLIRLICFTIGSVTTCDTSLIIIDNRPPNKTFIDTTPMNVTKVLAALPVLIFEGGAPTVTTSSSKITISGGVPTYKPTQGFVGLDTQYVYRCDAATSPNCDTTKYIILVKPDLADSVKSTTVNTPISSIGPAVSPSSNVTDVATAKSGIVTKNPDGTINYTPNPNFVGTDIITRIVCVTNPLICDTQIIIVNIAPKYLDTIVSVIPGSSATAGIPIRIIPGSSVTVTLDGLSHGTAVKNADGTVTYTPTAGSFGYDTVSKIVCVTFTNNTTICDTSWIIFNVGTLDSLSIPNYFSPNGDGVNDVWKLDALLYIYPNSKVIIYNRWGNIVWKSTGAYGKSTSNANIWYGQLERSQTPVPDGVYYYLIELEDNFRNNKTGFVEVMRR